jgi:hypothetical protein
LGIRSRRALLFLNNLYEMPIVVVGLLIVFVKYYLTRDTHSNCHTVQSRRKDVRGAQITSGLLVVCLWLEKQKGRFIAPNVRVVWDRRVPLTPILLGCNIHSM